MSLSYLRRKKRLAYKVRLGLSLGVALTGASTGELAIAQEVYVQPRAEVRAEVDTNRDFVTGGGHTASEGYAVNAGATLGISTPLSDTIIRPQVGYVDYPKDGEDAVQGTLDLASTYHSQRSDFSIWGQFDRRDTYSSELASALFNTVVPISPTTPETGLVTTNTIRTLINIDPTYSYQLTQRLRIGVQGLYESTDYSGAFSDDYASYHYSWVSPFVGWSISPRVDVTFGPFVSRDAARTGGDVADGTGADLAFSYKWSKTFSGKLELTGERDDITLVQPTLQKTQSNDFGATYTTAWTGQISNLQLSAGRTFTPSGAGGKYRDDQLQFEYDRKLVQRLSTSYAVRYIRAEALAQAQADDYKYLEAIASIKWLASRTWYVEGGLEYMWLNHGTASAAVIGSVAGSAGNGMLYVGFGYEGLGKRP